MSKKKVLLVIDDLGSGGAQNQLTLLSKSLSDKGFEVAVFTYFPDSFFKPILDRNKIQYINIQKKGKLGFNVIWELKKIIKTEKIDVVISFLDTPNFYAALSKKLSLRKLPLIVSYRSKTDFENISFLELKRKKWVNTMADRIVSNSHHERLKWSGRYTSLAKKWSTIYNQVNKDKFYTEDLNLVGSSYLVVGSIGPAKNGLQLVEAMNILKKEDLKINLKWIGQKVFHLPYRKAYLEKMESKIKEYKLKDQWEWKDAVQNIEKYYLNSKALILASETEGLPNVVCEALNCGLPCLVSDSLDHPILIENGVNGYLFNPQDPESLAESIRKFEKLKSDDIQGMKKNATNKARDLFDNDEISRKFTDLINELI